MNRSDRTGKIRHKALALAGALMLAVAIIVASAAPSPAWFSRTGGLIPNDSHTCITEASIKNVKNMLLKKHKDDLAAELETYSKDIIEGANNENTHELKVAYQRMDGSHEMNYGTNWGSQNPEVWLAGFAYYYIKEGDKPKAYYMLGSMMHLIQDQAAPAHASNIIHGVRTELYDNLELAAYRGRFIYNDRISDSSDSQETINPADYYYKVRLAMRRVIVDGHAFPPANDLESADYIKYYKYKGPGGKQKIAYSIWSCYWRQPIAVSANGTGNYGGGYIQLGDNQQAKPKDIYGTPRGSLSSNKDKANFAEELEFASDCVGLAVWATDQALYRGVLGQGRYESTSSFDNYNAVYPFLYP
ncbi:MAG: hypothetical protein ACYC99_17180 [Candidatus Geothermincolia bacterium]